MKSICTAPRDGTPILAYAFKGLPAVVWYHDDLSESAIEIHSSIGLSKWGNDHFFLYGSEITGWLPLPETDAE